MGKVWTKGNGEEGVGLGLKKLREAGNCEAA
jgi:hypothetical protein